MYIDGQFVFGCGDGWIDVFNLVIEVLLLWILDGIVEEVWLVIDVVECVQFGWEVLLVIECVGWLCKIVVGICQCVDEIVGLIVVEGGKIQQLVVVEVVFIVDYFDYMVEWVCCYEGEIVQSDCLGENIFVFKCVLGVIIGILLWNFLFFFIVCKLVLVFIIGNIIVIKFSEFMFNNVIVFVEIVYQVGLLKGVFNFVFGCGEIVGQELVGNLKVVMVSMIGSVVVGEKIMVVVVKNIIKVCFEFGGKVFVIVMDDVDLELVVKVVVDLWVINIGQVCNCVEWVYVQQGIYDCFVNCFGEVMKVVQFGDLVMWDDIVMGLLINVVVWDQVVGKVVKVVVQGVWVVLGGQLLEGKGYFYLLILLLDVCQEMDIIYEEIFGLVLLVVVFLIFDEVLVMVNDSDYGLIFLIYICDLNVVMKVIKGLKFGEIYINCENFEVMQGFYVGWCKLGIGGVDGCYGLNEYLQIQVVYLQV